MFQSPTDKPVPLGIRQVQVVIQLRPPIRILQVVPRTQMIPPARPATQPLKSCWWIRCPRQAIYRVSHPTSSIRRAAGLMGRGSRLGLIPVGNHLAARDGFGKYREIQFPNLTLDTRRPHRHPMRVAHRGIHQPLLIRTITAPNPRQPRTIIMGSTRTRGMGIPSMLQRNSRRGWNSTSTSSTRQTRLPS
jgi:hypothetical protein